MKIICAPMLLVRSALWLAGIALIAGIALGGPGETTGPARPAPAVSVHEPDPR